MTLPPRMKNLTGKRFGRLVVLGYSHSDHNRNSLWHCRCDCGTETTVYRVGLVGGKTRSCGCLKMESIATVAERTLLKHGHGREGSRTPTYRAWKGARERCNNPNHADYRNYGGRGIEMRFASVLELIADIGEKPDAPGLSLDRIDTNGHYEPGNVRWATAKQQANNRRRYMSPLTPDDVRAIRQRYAAGEASVKLGAEYGVSRQAIAHIVKRRTWTSVP